MTAQLTVASSPVADASGDVAQVIASLPVSLHPAEGGGDLIAIAGIRGWAEAAAEAIASGARGLLIVDPVAADVTSLRETASAAGVPVLVDATWTYNPAVAQSAGAFAAHHDADSLLEARVDVPIGSDFDHVLLSQLSLVRAAVGPAVHLEFARRTERGYDAMAHLAGGARAGVTAIATDSLPPAATLRILKPTTAVVLTVPSPTTASPGRAVVSGPEGATLLPTQYETAHRAAWRHLHRLVRAGETSTDLEGFAQDVCVVRGAL